MSMGGILAIIGASVEVTGRIVTRKNCATALGTKIGRYIYVAAKATYIRLLHGKIGFLGFFFRP